MLMVANIPTTVTEYALFNKEPGIGYPDEDIWQYEEPIKTEISIPETEARVKLSFEQEANMLNHHRQSDTYREKAKKLNWATTEVVVRTRLVYFGEWR